ncbi:MAG: hypothetical protein E7614_08960 [Ruminococcaceae bacterium]|nr:hypothetical protein [Oscillospiraceae bacterium]
MKKFLSIALFLCILLFFTACGTKPYSFEKSIDEIQSVEIVFAKSSLDFTVIKTLSETEKNVFFEQYQEIGFHRYYIGDPMSIYGDAIKITYQNGDYEMICHYWSEYVEDGRIHFGWKNCNEEEFNKLLNKFLSEDGQGISDSNNEGLTGVSRLTGDGSLSD